MSKLSKRIEKRKKAKMMLQALLDMVYNLGEMYGVYVTQRSSTGRMYRKRRLAVRTDVGIICYIAYKMETAPDLIIPEKLFTKLDHKPDMEDVRFRDVDRDYMWRVWKIDGQAENVILDIIVKGIANLQANPYRIQMTEEQLQAEREKVAKLISEGEEI